MTTNESAETEKGLFFWVFLGPISMLISLSLLITHMPADFAILPLVLLIGVVLTWLYRANGFFAAICLLFATSLYHLTYNEADAPYWFLGSMATVAFSYLITLLTLEEATNVVTTWRESALAAPKTISETEERIGELEIKYAKEKRHLLDQVKDLEAKQAHYFKEQESMEKVQELSRLELLSTISKHDRNVEELYDLKHEKRKLEDELEQLTERFTTNQKLVEKLQGDNTRGDEMRTHIDTLTREKDLLESTLSRIQAELEDKDGNIARLSKSLCLSEESINQLKQELSTREESLEAIRRELQSLKETPPEVVKEVVYVPSVIDPIPLDAPPASESDYRRLFGMHKQLKEQFAEKSSQLDETRKELFFVLEKVNLLELDLKEAKASDSPELKSLAEELDTLSHKYEESLQEIANLESLVSTLL